MARNYYTDRQILNTDDAHLYISACLALYLLPTCWEVFTNLSRSNYGQEIRNIFAAAAKAIKA